MSEIFFHIGLHKTATTFLQKVVFPNIDNLNYIKINLIYDELIQITQEDILIYDADKVKSSLEKHFTNGKNLISAEALSGNPFIQYNNRYDILLKIKKSFPNAKIILGIRNQKSMLNSLYQQYIRQGGTKSRDTFFRINNYVFPHKEVYGDSTSYFNPRTLKYSAYLEAITDLFGHDNVLIYLFEELKNDFHSFISRFSSFFELHKPLVENKSVNTALPDSFYPFLRYCNNFFRTSYFEKGIIRMPERYIYFLAKYFDNKAPIDKSANMVYDLYKDLYMGDNKKTEGLLQADLKTLFQSNYY